MISCIFPFINHICLEWKVCKVAFEGKSTWEQQQEKLSYDYLGNKYQ